ncbi:MAG: ADP-ribosylation factor-like protein, partial [Promethearchaeota archaeon]
MLRQVHVFHEKKHLFTHSFALGFGKEELDKVMEVINEYISYPIPGKTHYRPLSNYQIFHQGKGNLYFLFVADLIDSINYMEKLVKRTIEKFSELFSNPLEIQHPSEKKEKFMAFLNDLQKEMHSKIAIAGPIKSGKTTLYNLLKSGEERTLMNFAKISNFVISNLTFDLWDFQLQDNFSLLWSKFLSGSDLIIVLIDVSNYNLKIINHLLSFQKKEARFSKFLFLANKIDLIKNVEIELEKIKNDLNIKDLIPISLIESGAITKTTTAIRNTLGLKEVLPENFEALMKEAEQLENEHKIVSAIAKYKDLIQICNRVQDFSYVNSFKLKVEELTEKLRQTVEKKKEQEKKIKFEVPEQIQFKYKVKPKTLPQSTLKPTTTIQEKTEQSSISSKYKSKLRPSDLVIDLEPLKREEMIKKKIIESPRQEIVPVKPEDIKSEEDYPKALQRMIINRGNYLSLNLTKQYLEEVKEVLDRPLTFEDLQNLA